MYQEFKVLSIREILVLFVPEIYLRRQMRVALPLIEQAEDDGDHAKWCFFQDFYTRCVVSLFMYRNPQYADVLATYEGPADEY